MKKTILIVAAVAVGTAAAFYFISKKTTATMHAPGEPEKRSHHKTDVFAKAKP